MESVPSQTANNEQDVRPRKDSGLQKDIRLAMTRGVRVVLGDLCASHGSQ